MLLRNLMAGGSGATGIKVGLVSWWDLEEASGTRADAHGSKPLTPVGTVGNVAAKNGNGSNASAGGYLGSSGSVSLHSGDFTIAGVFKTSQGQSGIISRNGTSAAIDRQFLIALDNPSGTFYFGVSTNGTSNAALLTGSSGYNNGNLHTFICWRDTAANTINASVDGGATVSTAMTGATSLYNATDPGWTLHGIGTGTYVNGSVMDSVGIWSRMLTGTERSNLYNSGSWQNYAGLAGI